MFFSDMKVFVPNPIHKEAVRFLREHVPVVLWDDPAVEYWREEADGMIVRGTQVRKADLPRCKKLKVVGKHGIGVDTIDVDDVRKAGIKVVYTPYENIESVAELAVAFMLGLSRNMCALHASIRNGKCSLCANSPGIEMAGKTVGIVGLGKIGRRVGEILSAAFAMEIYGYDPFLPDEAWERMPFKISKCNNVAELGQRSDYVTVHVPLTDQTRNLIGAEELKHFRSNAIVVNTARGGIVDEDALYKALKSGRIRAAGSDVFATEPPSPAITLFELDNFWGLPHVGASTEDALYRMGMTVAADIVSVLGNGEAKYYVPA